MQLPEGQVLRALCEAASPMIVYILAIRSSFMEEQPYLSIMRIRIIKYRIVNSTNSVMPIDLAFDLLL